MLNNVRVIARNILIASNIQSKLEPHIAQSINQSFKNCGDKPIYDQGADQASNQHIYYTKFTWTQ